MATSNTILRTDNALGDVPIAGVLKGEKVMQTDLTGTDLTFSQIAGAGGNLVAGDWKKINLSQIGTQVTFEFRINPPLSAVLNSFRVNCPRRTTNWTASDFVIGIGTSSTNAGDNESLRIRPEVGTTNIIVDWMGQTVAEQMAARVTYTSG